MTYRVIWTEEAVNRLAEVWMAATDRNAITRAAHEIEVALEVVPMSTGEVLYNTVRQFGDATLSVEFEVVESKRCVYVLNVWSTAEGQPGSTGN